MTPGHLRPVDEVTAPDVQQLGDAVLIQGDALRDLYIALHRAIRACPQPDIHRRAYMPCNSRFIGP